MTLPALRLETGGRAGPSPRGARLEVAGLRKSFGGLEVLRGVDLRPAPGRVTALVGPNGAGKSTLVKSVLGLVRPGGGVIRLDGVPLGEDPRPRAAIGYMPQLPRFPENLTGAEVLALLRGLRGPGVATDEALLDRFRLRDQLGKPVRTLSGGTRQKLNGAIAFLFAPRLLLLDEPTAGLDPAARAVLKDRIREVSEAGATVLISSHVMAELEDLAQDLVVLIEGQVVYHGAVRELVQRTGLHGLERAVASLLEGTRS
ncbi:MAG TPA: ABC transporter ATP-binding protein [Gemmatimonadales bacterium]|nr:ABC transporter ATP-binding protein [Gemmatimonadales bacterium]